MISVRAIATVRNSIFAVVLGLVTCVTGLGQSTCITPDEIKAMISGLNSTQSQPANKKLREELIRMAMQADKLRETSISKSDVSQDLKNRLEDTRDKNNARLCQILKDNGWPTSAMVGRDGVGALLSLIRGSGWPDFRRSLLPVIDVAVKKGEVQKPDLAVLIDRIRVDAGLKQMFGTLVRFTEGFLVLIPIEREKSVDARRKEFGLPPLAEEIRALEQENQRPLIRAVEATQAVESSSQGVNTKIGEEPDAKPSEDEDVVRVNTNLVSLNVSVFSKQSQSLVGSLTKDDFKIAENGQEQAIDYFAATDVPFDLVLLIDLSGSTAQKRDLVRKTTTRFIQAARPADRLAIVTFSDTTNVICPLTDNRNQLLGSVDQINGTGGTNFWDALNSTLADVLGPSQTERRRAVVAMTDGVDNSLGFPGLVGSKTLFADLVETVRKRNELIIPIYLDTERDRSGGGAFSRTMYENARNTLALLAQESGGYMYRARKIEDLNGVYEQVINDLGKVYSVGYRPTNDKRDGSWRRVTIMLPNHPDLVARSRPGYYAN